MVSSTSEDKEGTDFSVTCHDGRTLHLRAASQVERDGWVAALTQARLGLGESHSPAGPTTSLQPALANDAAPRYCNHRVVRGFPL